MTLRFTSLSALFKSRCGCDAFSCLVFFVTDCRVYEPEAGCCFREVFDAVCDDELACYAPVLSGNCRLGESCCTQRFSVLCIHRIQVLNYLNTSVLSPPKKSKQSPFRMAGL